MRLECGTRRCESRVSRSVNIDKPVEAVLVGAGRRGYNNFGRYALRHPDELRFVAVAEPQQALRERFARDHDIPPRRRFRSWEDLAHQEPLAPALMNATNDTSHYASTVAAIEAGYKILLEKPVATTGADCVSLVQAADRTGADVWVCHELRNTDFFSKVHSVVSSGRLGDIVSVDHRENVAYWHMAHSFVRGNWSNSKTSGPMILTKCCHDLDILTWTTGRRVKRISSLGSLAHFRRDQAPHPDVPDRCTDGCPVEDKCLFYAPRLYLNGIVGALANAISLSDDTSSRTHALRTGPYGRCVYRCDNDMVDHQTVNMELEGGVTITLTMQGHSHVDNRTMRYDGTRGTLIGTFGGAESEIAIHDHATGDVERMVPHTGGGHGGGDERLVQAFVAAMRGEPPVGLSNVQEALESHLLAFAAESRVARGAVVDMEEFRRSAQVSVGT